MTIRRLQAAGRTVGVMLLGTLCAAAPAMAQTAAERETARQLVAKQSDAVVLALATIKTRVTVQGRENARDLPMQANATVLDGTGLAVMALSNIEPGELATRMGAGAVESEATDLRMRLGDGREVPAKIVLRDADLDLAFIKPIEAPASPMPAVDGPIGTPALLDLLVAVQRTGEATSWRTLATFAYVQLIVDRPRPYHALSAGAALGSPLFDLDGRFVGVMVRIGGARNNPLPVVLPAQDIREIAKQAK